MAECNIDKSCFDDVKMCVKVNSVNGIKPNTDGEVDIDEKFVTTNTTQTIHGSKTFTNTIKTNGMNKEAMLTTMNGLTINTAPTVINKSSIKWNDKERNEVSSIEVSRPANTKDTCISLSANTITEWGSNEKASVEVHAKAGATSYATAPTPSSNATGNEIVTAEWVIDKGLADDTNVVHKTGNETINGIKTFTQEINIQESDIDLTITPTSNKYSQFFFKDKNNKILGIIQYAQRSTDVNDLDLYVYDKNSSAYGIKINTNKELLPIGNNYSLGSSSGYKWNDVYATTFNGNLNGNADSSTKASYLDNYSNPNANKIYLDWDTQVRGYIGLKVDNTTLGGLITTEDIGYKNAVHKTGDETITGTKTFNTIYSDEINTDIIGTKYIQHYGDDGFLSTLTLPKHSGKVALQERTRANAEPVNRTLLYECAGGLDKGDITLSNMYTKYNALVIVYSDDDGDYMSTYYLDCAELDIRRNEAGSGTFLLVDGHSYWACTGASTGSKFVHATNNGLRIHKIYGLAEFY